MCLNLFCALLNASNGRHDAREASAIRRTTLMQSRIGISVFTFKNYEYIIPSILVPVD